MNYRNKSKNYKAKIVAKGYSGEMKLQAKGIEQATKIVFEHMNDICAIVESMEIKEDFGTAGELK